MRHPITGRRISREKYEAQQVLFAKRYAEMKAEEQTKASTPCLLCGQPVTWKMWTKFTPCPTSKDGKSGHALECSPDSIGKIRPTA